MIQELFRKIMLVSLILLGVCISVNAQEYATEVSSGSYYRIYSLAYNTPSVMNEVLDNHSVNCVNPADDDYKQVWQLSVDNGNVSLRNAVTGRYINAKGGSPFTTTTSASTFLLGNTEDNLFYFRLSGTNNGLHHQSNGHVVVSWGYTAGASQWKLEKVEVKTDILSEQQQDYTSVGLLRDNAPLITSILKKYFSDAACTTLQTEYISYCDEALTALLEQDGLPQTVIEMTLKVKNKSWDVYDENWDKTEKSFRINSYKAYSSYNVWNNIIGTSYAFSRITNPTGITVKANDIITLYVGEIPTGQKIQVENVGSYSAAGTLYDLKEGFNAIKVAEDGNLFINYNVDNTTGGKAPFTRIDSYNPVDIHIEGGEVNGYLDITKGDDNNDWKMLQQHLLDKHPYLQLKTNKLVFNMNASLVKESCPEKMTELLSIWDKIVSMEHREMGVDEFEGYWNNMLSATSIISNNHMFATTYGTYYNEYTLKEVMNYEKMFNGGDNSWGVAHENGHHNQKLINMVGANEVSNNLFSNIALYENGHMTQRSAYLSSTFDNMAAGKFWIERDGSERHHMYFQLYQFFELQGYKDNFYPELFKAFRADPMNHRGGVFIPANEDYLKFYEKACEVSGYDLTEFFQAYGFFVLPEQKSYTLTYDKTTQTQDAYYYSDYAGTFYLTISQEMIDAAKARVKSMNLPKANIIFLEDRITAPQASYEGAPEGENKTTYPGYVYGKGDVGQYTDFNLKNSANGYFASYAENEDGSLGVFVNHSNATGAVGFKIYDAEGNLAYLSNTYEFTLPAIIYSQLKGTNFSLEAAGTDGTNQQMNAGEHYINWIVMDENDNVLKSIRKTQFVGDVISEYPNELSAPFVKLPALKPFTYNEPEKRVITATITTPFKVSTETSLSYYYIKVRNGYLSDNEGIATLTTNKLNEDSYRWTFYGDPYAGYKLQNKATGKWLNTGTNYASGQIPQMSEVSSNWTIDNWPGKESSFMLKVQTANAWLNDFGGKGTKIAYYGSGSEISVEHIIMATALAPFTANGLTGFWGTFYSESNCILPDDMKAFRAENVDNTTNVVSLLEVDGNILAGGEGYLIYSQYEQRGAIFTETTEEVVSNHTNLLRGSEEAKTLSGEGTYYILSRQKQADNTYKFGFFWQYETEGKYVDNGANKAFLLIPSATSAKGYLFEWYDTPTNINTIKQNESEGDIYNLNGQKVKSGSDKLSILPQGIYIRNGKKYIKK